MRCNWIFNWKEKKWLDWLALCRLWQLLPLPPFQNNTRNLSQTYFPDRSDMGLHWKHMGFCHQGPVWHLLLLNILRSFQVSFALPNATFHLSTDSPISSFRLLWHILSFICLCYLKKEREGENTSQMNGQAVVNQKLPPPPLHLGVTFLLIGSSFLSELQQLDVGRNGIVCNLVPLCSEPLSELTDQATFLCKPLQPRQESLPCQLMFYTT